MKKYEFTDETIKTPCDSILHRIKALVDIGGMVKAGDLGGFIEKEENLSHEGKAWVFDNARVCDNARVYEDAWVCDDASVSDSAMVFGDASVCENAEVYCNARVSGKSRVYANAKVSGNVRVLDDAKVYGNANVSDDARVSGKAKVSGDALVFGDARVYGNAMVSDNASVSGNARVFDDAKVSGNVKVFDDACVYDNATVSGCVTIYGSTRMFNNANVYGHVPVSDNESVPPAVEEEANCNAKETSVSSRNIAADVIIDQFAALYRAAYPEKFQKADADVYTQFVESSKKIAAECASLTHKHTVKYSGDADIFAELLAMHSDIACVFQSLPSVNDTMRGLATPCLAKCVLRIMSFSYKHNLKVAEAIVEILQNHPAC